MTALIAWVSVDSRSPSAIYIAADSRLTIQNSNGEYTLECDDAQKTFSSTKHPIIAGYCGGSRLITTALTHVFGQLDATDSLDFNNKAIINLLQKLILEGIKRSSDFPDGDKIIFCWRDSESKFHCLDISLTSKTKLSLTKITLPPKSGLLRSTGLGAGSEGRKNELRKYFWTHYFYRWSASSLRNTSRAVFGAFCDFLLDPYKHETCGGPPQIVGLFRSKGPQDHGVWFFNKPFFQGKEWNPKSRAPKEWRDRLFQRVDETGTLVRKGQRQPCPIMPS